MTKYCAMAYSRSMKEQLPIIEEPTLYERMKQRGVDMGWYEKNKGRSTYAIPLSDEECGFASIYLLKKNGTLWTLKGEEDISPHAKVRDTKKEIPQDVLMCVKCRKQFDNLLIARSPNHTPPIEVTREISKNARMFPVKEKS